ncbi:MAG: hypothetical protein CL840_14305 [Crocinitomicaceae bacterium]|nr:hypothetical protein [Crocinitomicaceae bacterium]|tara:strand:- start:9836 stop:11008 length:1173 start_codon:yes stop_codon:yes gene_type:complete
MSNQIVDVINFNADASCLECDHWFNALKGGNESLFYSWLNLYVTLDKKVVLGIPGATLADIAMINSESIELIRNNPQVFELTLRPFAHDNALLRTRYGFEKNLEYGIKTVDKLFGKRPDYFLPPEFMLNSEQVYVLSQNDMVGTFVNPARFSDEAKSRIPDYSYKLRGVFGAELNCHSFNGKLTKAFLEGIHFYNADKWNKEILEAKNEVVFNWRDGESAFLIPDTLAREEAWLKGENPSVKRMHLADLNIEFTANDDLEPTQYKGYPFHSFAPWLKEMRMIGFTSKVAKIEEILEDLSDDKIFHWLQIINSDILSAVEKNSPRIKLQSSANSKEEFDFRIWRTERAFEGEDYLTLLKQSEKKNGYQSYLASDAAHLKKFNLRMDFLRSL